MDKELIQVLSMGRVGSITTQRSIEKRIGRKVAHIHSINPALLATQVAKAGSVSRVAPSVQEGLAAVAQLVRHQGAVKTVTLVRDSIARNLSAAFANLRKEYPQLEELDEFLSAPNRVRAVWREFYDRRPYIWFDNELCEILGVDVYQYPFDPEGVVTIRHGRHEILIVRTELEDAAKSEALAKFFGVSALPLYIHNNESRKTTFRTRYELFRRSIALEEDYLRTVAQSKYTRHFYASWAVDDYVEYWMRETRPILPSAF